jgi:hypothetical protein
MLWLRLTTMIAITGKATPAQTADKLLVAFISSAKIK